MPDLQNNILFPTQLNLSSEKLDRQQLFLLDSGSEIFIWIGRNADPGLIRDIFGFESVKDIPPGKTTIHKFENELSVRFTNLISEITEIQLHSNTCYPYVYLVPEESDPQLRIWFLSHLIEDRIESMHSYPQFMNAVREKIPKK